MAKKQQYASVSEMLADIERDESLRSQYDEHVAQRQVVKLLLALRASRGVTQKAIAERLGWKQPKVSKIENGRDDDLRLGDLRKYLAALNLSLGLAVAEADQKPVDEIKRHVLAIRRLLRYLTELAGGDEAMEQEFAKFLGELSFNVALSVFDSASKLSTLPKPPDFSIKIEVCNDDISMASVAARDELNESS